MAEQRTVIQFHETFCEVFTWQADRGVLSLAARLYVALENTPEPSEKADYLEAVQRNGAALQQALRQASIRIRQAVVVIPKHWVTLRFVTLPSDEPGELAEMARFEAGRHIPFNMDRHVVDHHLLAIEGLEGARVVLAALDGPPANEITQIMDIAGIEISALEVSSIALTNSLQYCALWDAKKNPTIAHIDIEQETTDITILHEGQPIFARSVSLGIERLFGTAAVEAPGAEAESVTAIPLNRIQDVDLASVQPQTLDLGNPDTTEPRTPEPRAIQMWKNRFIQEIRQSYDFARRELDCQPLSSVFLSGPGARLKNIAQVLKEQIPSIDVVLVDPMQVSDSATTRLQADESLSADARDGVSMACAIGALLRDSEPNALRINLLPPEYLRSHARTRQRRSLITTAALAGLLTLCLALFAFQSLQMRRTELKMLKEQIQNNSRRVEEIRYRQTVVKILKSNSSEKQSALALLNTISSWEKLFQRKRMRIALTEYNYTEGKSVKLVGHADTIRDLNDFQTRLEDSEHFAEVYVESRPPYRFPQSKREVLRFTLNCYFTEKKGRKRR